MRRGYVSEIFASFQGEGLHVGRRHLFLRLAGCHLRCRYCDTPDSLERTQELQVHLADGTIRRAENPVTSTALLAYAAPLLQTGALDGMAITGGEPLLQSDFLAELLEDGRWPQPRLLETSGTNPEKLHAVLRVVDVVSMDIKLPSNTGEPPFWDTHREFLALAGERAYVKVLVDDATAPADVEQAARLVGEMISIPFFLQPITTSSGHAAINAATLERFFAIAKDHVADVRVLPQTHKMLGVR